MTADFHTHILPGIDDGSSSPAESLEMLRREAEQGITHVVATPHFYPRRDDPERFLRRREEAHRILLEETKGHSDLPELILGAEVRYFPGISESDPLPLLTIGQKRYILIEMPAAPWTERMYDELRQIREKQDLIPIIAHIDRYVSPLRNRDIPQRLAQLPVLVQANAGFFLNAFTSAMALHLLETGRIHLLGSDCHNLTDRSPRLGKAYGRIRNRLGEEALERIRLMGETILSGL